MRCYKKKKEEKEKKKRTSLTCFTCFFFFFKYYYHLGIPARGAGQSFDGAAHGYRKQGGCPRPGLFSNVCGPQELQAFASERHCSAKERQEAHSTVSSMSMLGASFLFCFVFDALVGLNDRILLE